MSKILQSVKDKPSDKPSSKEAGSKSAADTQDAASAGKPKSDEESLKETFESIIIAFILAFVFRAYVVEAFVIPTGSMAPTLLGQHVRVDCQQCGYHFKADPEATDLDRDGKILATAEPFYCPMCKYPNALPFGSDEGTRSSAGDRILVHKYLYSINEPERFDVVVFKSPHAPGTNYIKRLVGLPGQDTALIEGNVYYNPTPDDPKGWRIARKTDDEENSDAIKIQKALWRHVYHSQYVPADFTKPSEDRDDRVGNWLPPWRIAVENGKAVGTWKNLKVKRNNFGRVDQPTTSTELDPHDGYRLESSERGLIWFDFQRQFEGGPGYYPYSQHNNLPPMYYSTHVPRRSRLDPTVDHGVEDVRVAATATPDSDGLAIRLRTTTRMDDEQGVMRVLIGEIAADGTVSLYRKQSLDAPDEDKKKLGESVQIDPLEAGDSRQVELWYVDQEASVWVDGDQVLRVRFDLPFQTIVNRKRPCEETAQGAVRTSGRVRAPRIAIELSGSPATLRDVEVDRDMQYTLSQGKPGRSVIYKPGYGMTPQGSSLHLEKDQFFCLGDNSPFSHDSRAWPHVNDWVKLKTMRPGLEYENALGIVPRRLMMGKAFFVYFPAPYGVSDSSFPFIPNFGEMRFIH